MLLPQFIHHKLFTLEIVCIEIESHDRFRDSSLSRIQARTELPWRDINSLKHMLHLGYKLSPQIVHVVKLSS